MGTEDEIPHPWSPLESRALQWIVTCTDHPIAHERPSLPSHGKPTPESTLFPQLVQVEAIAPSTLFDSSPPVRQNLGMDWNDLRAEEDPQLCQLVLVPHATHPWILSPSSYPPDLQAYYTMNPRSNTATIERILSRVLKENGRLHVQLTRLPAHRNILIPSTIPTPERPSYWAIRVSCLISQQTQDTIWNSVHDALDSGCKVSVKGNRRTDAQFQPFHAGVLFRSSQLNQPWVTNDLLQKRGPASAQQVRRQKMLHVLRSVDKLANGPVQRVLNHIDRLTWRRHHAISTQFRQGL
ncbi:hypothetical protein BD324DRAFT_654235 [Kockovaella imperatae]|uniref:Uncharacterized protein n=1 Tax=Kockovaella imperatae TaxID=4999 RepID=A0A1Y1U5N1_9TREE|nr:hypothetical protein BD324DRAFT_654235 [Kockovaella imperatae]ORX33339.1 hypothetical protein BD324DRAFT_654235 [Kockovaella imperatae]